MTNLQKKRKIKSLVKEMLKESHKAMIGKIDRTLNSGAIDIDAWSESYAPMILPKCIVIALLQNESRQYSGRGTSFEKRVKREVKNISYFL